MLSTLTDEVQKLKDEIEQAVVDVSTKKHRRYRKLLSADDGMFCLYHLDSFLFCLWEGCTVLWWVCLFVCSFAQLKMHMAKRHQFFCDCCLWPWLSSSLVALQYIMYFRFCGLCHDLHAVGSSDASCAFLSSESITAKSCFISFNQILLRNTQQQVHIIYCAPVAKSVIYDCLVLIEHWNVESAIVFIYLFIYWWRTEQLLGWSTVT